MEQKKKQERNMNVQNNRHIKYITDKQSYIGGYPEKFNNTVCANVPINLENINLEELQNCTVLSSEIVAYPDIIKEGDSINVICDGLESHEYSDVRPVRPWEQFDYINLLGDLPKETELKNTNLCGYISPNGKYYQCDHCEHLKIIRKIVLTEYLNDYMEIEPSFYDTKPSHMLQEEYFLMKHMKFVKISSFKNEINKMFLFTYNTLTPEQTDIVYPR